MTDRRAVLRATAAGLAGLLSGSPSQARTPLQSAFSRTPPRVPELALVDQDGRAVRLPGALNGGAVAINFIYTGCASFCPPQTAIFRSLQQRLAATPALPGRLLSLSIDPLNDTPAALARYAQRFEARLGANERWLMLTGGRSEVDAVLAAFGVHAASLAEHPSQVWVGHYEKRRWLRVLGLAGAEELLQWMREAAA